MKSILATTFHQKQGKGFCLNHIIKIILLLVKNGIYYSSLLIFNTDQAVLYVQQFICWMDVLYEAHCSK